MRRIPLLTSLLLLAAVTLVPAAAQAEECHRLSCKVCVPDPEVGEILANSPWWLESCVTVQPPPVCYEPVCP